MGSIPIAPIAPAIAMPAQHPSVFVSLAGVAGVLLAFFSMTDQRRSNSACACMDVSHEVRGRAQRS